MTRHFVEIRSISDWQSRLGDPDLHWKRGASAMELAVSWTLARRSQRGMPETVAALLDSNDELAGSSVAFAIPELRTILPGGSTSSQTDLWALLRSGRGSISLSVEGKALEPFGEAVERWLGTERPERLRSAGKVERLEFLTTRLGLNPSAIGTLRYQLLHRTAAALLEAEQWGASAAVLVVQRFKSSGAKETSSWNDFREFASRLKAEVQPNRVRQAQVPGNTPLFLAWLDCRLATDEELIAAMTNRPIRTSTRQNAFEALCRRAASENWCWKLTCMTCGCMHFRYGLLELSQRRHPKSTEWLTSGRVHIDRLRQSLGELAAELPINAQQEVVAIASGARLTEIATNAKFPDWLGYLGIVLNFCHGAEAESLALTKSWARQLGDMIPDESSLKRRLIARADSPIPLSLRELEEVEHELQRTTRRE